MPDARRMRALGVDRFLEVGPGRVLSGLIARIERRAARANFSEQKELEEVRTLLAESKGIVQEGAA